jgi:hypothetical protein
MQIWDVSQFTTVLGGGNPWVPTYNEDFSLYDMGVTNLGEPRAGRGIRGATPNATRGPSIAVTSIIKDEGNSQFIVFLKDVGVAAHQSMGIVINVAR